MKKDNNTYLLREYYSNGVKKVSRSRVYDKQHFLSYLNEMEIGDTVTFKNNNGTYRIKKELEVEIIEVLQ